MYMTATRNVMDLPTPRTPSHFMCLCIIIRESKGRTERAKKKKRDMLHVFVTPNLPLPFFLMPRCWAPFARAGGSFLKARAHAWCRETIPGKHHRSGPRPTPPGQAFSLLEMAPRLRRILDRSLLTCPSTCRRLHCRGARAAARSCCLPGCRSHSSIRRAIAAGAPSRTRPIASS